MGKKRRQVAQTREALEAHLADCIYFLETSANSYDAGYKGEAKRLAVTLRVLLHDTKVSHSLLGQLGRLNVAFYDTAKQVDTRNLPHNFGLVFVHIGPIQDEGEIRPRLDYGVADVRMTPFEQWWNAIVIVDSRRQVFTRRDLVGYVANKDGGAHVDPQLDEPYVELSRRNSMAWGLGGGETFVPLEGPERASIRQIAHEVLKTLKPGYEVHHP